MIFEKFLEPWLLLFASDPVLRATQGAMLMLLALQVFLVFFTARDILRRTHSFAAMLACILLVAFLPGIGFLAYLLVRPVRTLAERRTDMRITEVLDMLQAKGKAKHPHKSVGGEAIEE